MLEFSRLLLAFRLPGRPRPRLRFTIAWAAITLVASTNAQAQNLAGPNTDLNVDDNGWSYVGSGSRVGNDDANGCTGGAGSSGSLVVHAELPSQVGDPSIAAAYPLACIPVLPGETIHTEIAYKSAVDADVSPVYFDTENCTGSQTQVVIDATLPAAATWTLAADVVTVPAGALSMLVAWAAADPNGLPFDTAWDRAYAGRAARIFSDDFEAASTCRWSAVSALVE